MITESYTITSPNRPGSKVVMTKKELRLALAIAELDPDFTRRGVDRKFRNKISVIKVIREAFDLGLKEACVVVEGLCEGIVIDY